jgi:hypothetical protein
LLVQESPPGFFAIFLIVASAVLRYVGQARCAGACVELIAIPRAGHCFDAISGSMGNQRFRASIFRFLEDQGLRSRSLRCRSTFSSATTSKIQL